MRQSCRGGRYGCRRELRRCIQKLEKWINQIVAMPETREFLLAQGAEPLPGSSAAATKMFVEADEAWAKIVKLAKIDPSSRSSTSGGARLGHSGHYGIARLWTAHIQRLRSGKPMTSMYSFHTEVGWPACQRKSFSR